MAAGSTGRHNTGIKSLCWSVKLQGHSRELDASVGASGPHDFTVGKHMCSSKALFASTPSRPAFPAPSVFRGPTFLARLARKHAARSRSHVPTSLRGALLSAEAPLRAKADATKQSSFLPCCAKAGLLRGACHRARVRATRWLAMTMLGCSTSECEI